VRTPKKKDKIKDGAKTLFFKFGIKRISIDEICTAAGISKVTFYKYYRNKLELAIELRDELMVQGFAAFDEISALDIPFLEKIDRMTQWQMEFFTQMNNEFIREIASIEDIEEEYKKRFLANIQAAQDKGEVRRDINLELLYLVTRKLNELTREGAWRDIFAEYGQYVEQVRKIIFFGLLTRSDENTGKTRG
jgi:AcrR family transcriptional regulator